jgi:hypothetical protein
MEVSDPQVRQSGFRGQRQRVLGRGELRIKSTQHHDGTEQYRFVRGNFCVVARFEVDYLTYSLLFTWPI